MGHPTPWAEAVTEAGARLGSAARKPVGVRLPHLGRRSPSAPFGVRLTTAWAQAAAKKAAGYCLLLRAGLLPAFAVRASARLCMRAAALRFTTALAQEGSGAAVRMLGGPLG